MGQEQRCACVLVCLCVSCVRVDSGYRVVSCACGVDLHPLLCDILLYKPHPPSCFPAGEGHMHIWRNRLVAGCVDKNSFGKHGLLHIIYVRWCEREGDSGSEGGYRTGGHMRRTAPGPPTLYLYLTLLHPTCRCTLSTHPPSNPPYTNPHPWLPSCRSCTGRSAPPPSPPPSPASSPPTTSALASPAACPTCSWWTLRSAPAQICSRRSAVPVPSSTRAQQYSTFSPPPNNSAHEGSSE